MRILHRGSEHCFQYHLICSLYLVNISMTGVHSGICAKYLYNNQCCQIFNICKGHNYLGGKSPKFASSEILSLLFS